MAEATGVTRIRQGFSAVTAVLLLSFVAYAYAAVLQPQTTSELLLDYPQPTQEVQLRGYFVAAGGAVTRLPVYPGSNQTIRIPLPELSEPSTAPQLWLAVRAAADFTTLWALQSETGRAAVQQELAELALAVETQIAAIQATPRYQNHYAPKITAILNKSGEDSFAKTLTPEQITALQSAAGVALPEDLIEAFATRLLVNILDQGLIAGMNLTLGQTIETSVLKSALDKTLSEAEIRDGLEAGLKRFVAHPATQETVRAFVQNAAQQILSNLDLKEILQQILSDDAFANEFARVGESLQAALRRVGARLMALGDGSANVHALATEIVQAIILQRPTDLILIAAQQSPPILLQEKAGTFQSLPVTVQDP